MSASVWQVPLSQFQSEVAAPQPAPAGVAVACVTAALAVSLLVKVLRITGQRPGLLAPALQLIDELRSAADADIAAVHNYIQTRDPQALHDVPAHAGHCTARALALCAEASGSVTGLIAADIAAATELLQGAASAINACLTANRA
jgi:formiminotetrahydrofolate cyclodeaminase